VVEFALIYVMERLNLHWALAEQELRKREEEGYIPKEWIEPCKRKPATFKRILLVGA
jgi:hypothetical protein